jgi:hypothetical protein
MTEYIVVSGVSAGDLEQNVERKLRQGYKLQGGVAVVFLPSVGDRFYQAMVI